MRGATQQANASEQDANSTAAGYGSGASSIASTLTPYLTRELNNPQGISQQDTTAAVSADLAGAGGVAGGLQTRADERAAATGNDSGVGASMDDIARQREQAAAQASSAVANKNTDVKLQQQDQAATGLRGLYGTDVGAQLNAMGVRNNAIGQEVNAGSHGWFQNMTNLIASIRGGGQAPGASSPGGSGGGGGGGDDMSEDDESSGDSGMGDSGGGGDD